MRLEVIMPKMGESITEGTILKWNMRSGEPVKKDEILFEISTDKVDTEIPAPADGFMGEMLFNEGDTVEVGKIVCYLETDSAGAVAAEVEAPKNNSAVQSESAVTQSELRSSGTAEKQESIDITMPKMGESVMEGTIIKWHKKAGDSVNKDEIIFEISTDKVDTEVPSPADGILTEIITKEQETVEVGFIVARMSALGTAVNQAVFADAAISMHDSFSAGVLQELNPSPDLPGVSGDRFYSPLVISIAQKENVSQTELSKIQGTGTGGRVTKKDILNFIESRKSARTTGYAKSVSLKGADAGGAGSGKRTETRFVSGMTDTIPMDNVRRKIMEHMIHSRDTSVHVTGLVEVDMSGIYNYIKSKRELIFQQEGIKITYMSFVSYACIQALKEFPLVNSAIEGTSILQKRFINLGIAVALEPNGLIVPNIKDAQEKNFLALAASITEIAERARNKKLTPDDISGGTFTITNYGVFGTLFGTPIINQPEVAILGVGAVVKRAVVVESNGTDSIAIKPMMYLTLSHDHRLVDGMLGGKFLKTVKNTLENFSNNLVY